MAIAATTSDAPATIARIVFHGATKSVGVPVAEGQAVVEALLFFLFDETMNDKTPTAREVRYLPQGYSALSDFAGRKNLQIVLS
jgi:hypothetical protein